MRQLLLPTIIASLFSIPALADSKITLNDQFTLPDNSIIHISVPIGSLNVNTHEANEIELDITVKASDDNWFGSDDVSDASIVKRIKDNQVYLEVDLDDTVQNWSVTLPQSADIRFDVGVGQVEIENAEQDVQVDVGVGEVELTLTSDNYKRIDLDSGVGEVELEGFKNAKHDRAMVSETVTWHGAGKYEINIDVGVGEIEVEL